MHQGPTFFKTHFVHECLHQINAASAGGVDGPRRGWVRDVRKVKSSTLVSYGHADITYLAEAGNTDALSDVLVIAVNHGVIESFPHCGFNLALVSSNAPALGEQEDQAIYKGRNCSYLTWERVFNAD